MRSGHRFAALALAAGFAVLVTMPLASQVNGFNSGTFGGATIRGIPPSVTSIGFGGHPGSHGVPPSVTSLNFGRAPFHGTHFGVHRGPERHHHQRGEFSSPFLGGYYFPYDYGYGYNDFGYDVNGPGVDDSMEQNYPTGPTIFDRNGAAPAPRPQMPSTDYRAELNPEPPKPAAPVADQPSTVLIFKDGHEQEIKNYAILGNTLYDLSDGRTRKVQLAELDLPATVKQNDDRGITFELPAGTKLN